MTDKKTFASFIKARRIEKNYSQKDLAEKLFVTESAVSKWERGISYPDITLISEICRALDISEHELITASTDTDARKIKRDAQKFHIIRNTWILVPTILYAISLIVCFICNLAINHTLSWFYVVASSLICAYTFIPTITCFFETKKLLVFTVSTYLSVCLLLFTCSVYTDNFSWIVTACIGVLIGYVLFLLPVLLNKTKLTRFKFLISFSLILLLAVALLTNNYFIYRFDLSSAILITLYSFSPVIFCAIICVLRFNGFLKAGFCTLFCALIFYFLDYIVNLLFGMNENNYHVNFNNWNENINGNLYLIFLISFLLISAVFIGIGFIRTRKK